jgi:hypothetical protein
MRGERPEHSVFREEHSVFSQEHSVFLGEHSVFPPEHSVFLGKHSVFPPEHSVSHGKHSVFPPEHSVSHGKHSVFPPEHSVSHGKHSVSWTTVGVTPSVFCSLTERAEGVTRGRQTVNPPERRPRGGLSGGRTGLSVLHLGTSLTGRIHEPPGCSVAWKPSNPATSLPSNPETYLWNA